MRDTEQQGDDKAEYGARLLERLAEDLQHKPGKGFSVRNLRKMRRFYLNNRNRPAPADLTWTQHVELLPVTNKADKRRLERRIISDKLSPRQIRLEVRQLKEGELKGGGVRYNFCGEGATAYPLQDRQALNTE